ncbi:hypothetical protein GYMLUDRAFT_62335 [Collybiopsis luxurians FD-317 M1]|uniref:Uncharacterized protein n=1 Tax=Collybiopsis luxurians FD-317 M1 TaxID=944289 RepID=A0A0D0CKR3_9AGAR|nr:hypothetical protein GYMLUDRAFT_62335 [Collybiopsis luxurians FD-317 M1]
MTLILNNLARQCLLAFHPLSVSDILSILQTSDLLPSLSPTLNSYIKSFKRINLSSQNDQIILLILGTQEASKDDLQMVEEAVDHIAFVHSGPFSPPVIGLDIDRHGMEQLYSHFDVLGRLDIDRFLYLDLGKQVLSTEVHIFGH